MNIYKRSISPDFIEQRACPEKVDQLTIFGREFQIERLSDEVLNENRWLSDLLQLWHPSGDAISRDTDQEGKEHLRLAIRNGYLNFYRAGQSMAKVDFDHGGNLQAKIHNKYVYGKRDCDQNYVTLTADGCGLRRSRVSPRMDLECERLRRRGEALRRLGRRQKSQHHRS